MCISPHSSRNKAIQLKTIIVMMMMMMIYSVSTKNQVKHSVIKP